MAVLGGCSSGPAASGDSLTDVRDPKLAPDRRAEAVVEAWAETSPGTPRRAAVRDSLKDLAWSANAPVQVRLAALDQLLNDTDPEGLEDSRTMARLLLPNEQDRRVVTYLANLAAERGWTDMTPALVRQWSRELTEESDQTRVERRAIERLHPGVPPERVAFDVFVDPKTDPGPYKLRWDLRVRAAAWELLSRLDKDGSLRADLIAAGSGIESNGDDRTLADLRACWADLRVVPRNGEELRWLDSLRDPKKRGTAEWWAESKALASGLNDQQRQGLRLLHMEHVRWASSNRSEWLSRSREELLRELRGRMGGREIHERASGVEFTKRVSERLDRQEGTLSWGDVLTLLVLDEAARDERVKEALFSQIDMDRKDTSTEYGGMIGWGSGGFTAAMYPPRPSNRLGDRKFVASEDLIAASDRALAHYHFHVQRVQNREYAGPSEGDLDYAARLGRACLVFTSLNERTLNVDAYFPGGYVIDLGTVER